MRKATVSQKQARLQESDISGQKKAEKRKGDIISDIEKKY